MTLDEAFEEFRLALLADGRSLRTIESYAYFLRSKRTGALVFLSNLNVHYIDDVTTRHLREYIATLHSSRNQRTREPLSPITIADYIRTLHRFFSWCAREFDFDNPMVRISFPRRVISVTPKAASLFDVRKMLEYCDETPEGIRDRAVILTLIDTGCRAAGLCRLTVGDIDYVSRTIQLVEKGERPRLVSFSHHTASALMEWDNLRARVKPFFYTFRHMSAFTPDTLRHTLARIGERAGTIGHVNPHSFRHAFAINYLKNGGDIATLSRLMGHKDVATTIEHYMHFSIKELSQRHEMFSPVNDVV